MLLGSNLSPAEQAAFTVLLKFFEGESEPERKALILTSPFAALAVRRVGTLTEHAVGDLVMEVLVSCLDHPEIELLWAERRDTRRDGRVV